MAIWLNHSSVKEFSLLNLSPPLLLPEQPAEPDIPAEEAGVESQRVEASRLEASRLEASRLEALRAHQILDTPPEAAFDRIAALASRLFSMPIATVSLLDGERQWFKASIGFDVCQIPRQISFCNHTIQGREVLVVPDARLDVRFAASELVTGAQQVRFYAGAPLLDREGLAFGTLCVLDTSPREMSAPEQQTLADLAAVVVDELELRRAARHLEEFDASQRATQKALIDSQNRFKSAFEMSANGMALVSTQGRFLQVNEQLCALMGFSSAQFLTRHVQELTPPEELPDNLLILSQLLTGEVSNYNGEKRFLRCDGTPLWVSLSVAVVRDATGLPDHLVAQVQDISARKGIEQDLRQSEARKAAIVETALDCIISIDTQSRILEWNPAAEKTFGFSRAQALDAHLYELIIPADLQARHRAGLEKWQSSGQGPILGQRIELPAVRKDGTPITVELAVVPIPGSEPPLFTGHLRDISERRATEERLRLLESVAVNANDAILITEAEPVDLPGPRIRYANKAFLEMTGYTLEEIIGQTPRILQGEGTLEESKAKIRRALKAWKPVVVEMLNYKKDGTPFWVELSITPVANEKGWFTHWVSIQRDIGERRATLDALRESEGRYGSIAANVPGMVYQFVLRCDGSFAFPFVSDGCREIYDLEPEQVMADASVIMNYAHPDDARSFVDSIRLSAQTLESWEWEGRIEVPGRDPKWIRGTSRPKREASGEIIWDGILFDITGRKNQETLLEGARVEADGARIEAESARIEAERANLAKSEFLSRMSHELRTPLNAILGFGQLLQMSELPAPDVESSEQILKAGRHLLDLINEVLDIARIESGQLSLSSEAVSVREVTLETLDLVRPLAAQGGISLREGAIRSEEIWVRADRQRLKQVLLNLLSNAVKYNRPGGQVTLSCEIVGSQNAGASEGRVRIGVRDSGAGIAPEMRSRLFTAFDRLGAENSKVEGTGVGLALSRRLAEAMEGTLEVESEPGQGCLFWIELPRAEDPLGRLNALPEAPAAPAVVNTRLVVLYVEDNPSNLQLVQRLLAHRPEIRLLTAMQGGMGLELARQHCPDLILLDMNLPDRSGAEVLEALRADRSTASIPVVIVSADATPKQIARMMSAGAQRYLTKPFDVPEFLAILDGTLARQQVEEETSKIAEVETETEVEAEAEAKS